MTTMWQISIHAPPRGATRLFSHAGGSSWRFQFTPLREGRRRHPPAACPRRYFNSRPSARGDNLEHGNYDMPMPISIHAPPRGATIPPGFSLHRPVHFNSRPSARGDALRAHQGGACLYFNSRPSARGDHRQAGYSTACRRFQFTPLREGRQEAGSRVPVAI